ncbi:MAG: outer membrane protein assembly factor BamB [Pseudomonadota bacterium]
MNSKPLRALFVLLMSAGLLGGCSAIGKTTDTVGGWFGFGKKRAAQPAPLTEFVQKAGLSRAWTASAGEAGRGLFMPAVDGNAVYAAGESGRVVRLGLQNGNEAWRVDTGRKLAAGVGAGAGLVLVGGLKGELIALDAANGAKRWEVNLASVVVAPPVVAGDLVLVRTGNGHVHGLNAADGSRKWLYTRQLPALSLQGVSALAIRDGVAYAGFPGGKMAAIRLDNGLQVWEVSVSTPRGATELERVNDVVGMPALDDRRVCAVTYQGRVACFDRIKGNQLWSRDTSSDAGLSMDDLYVYVSDDKDAVTAYDKDSGRAAWRQDKLANRQITAPLVFGKYVVVADVEGYVHLISTEDGSFAARAQADGQVRVTPIDIGPGFAVQSVKGGVIAFKVN